MIVLKEASTSTRKYSCPYCKERKDRKSLIGHISSKHEDQIPEGYTAARVVFNLINKKETGHCVICKRETTWDETKCRYNRLCDDPRCHKEYKEMVESRIKKIYGKTSREMLNDPDQQKRMLAHRKISGIFRWKDGSEKTYTGTYEKKALEFCQAFGFKSEDVITPGPVIEYTYNGQPHMWITDIYIAPYNLAIDVKDGGDNPNNREMEDYRNKQVEKEAAIKRTNYNYLRLTNNDFKQLIEVLTLLKLQLVENNKDERIYKINESMFAGMAGFFPPGSTKDSIYIVNYKKNNVFSPGIGIAKDFKIENLIIRDQNHILRKVDSSYLEDATYTIYRYDRETDLLPIKENLNQIVSEGFLYETIFRKKYYTMDQLLSEDLKEIPDYYSYLKIVEEITIQSLLPEKPYYLSEHSLDKKDVQIYQDEDGIFLKSNKNDIRTKSKNSIDEFSSIEFDIIRNGVI